MYTKFASKTLLALVAGSTIAFSAMAQWQWIDKDGRKVFSDRLPPVEIQDKDILKRPGVSVRPTAVAAADLSAPTSTSVKPLGAASAPAAKASIPKLSGKDAELEANKKKAEEE